MAGNRILYFTTKGIRTTQRIWKALTTRGLEPAIDIPDNPTGRTLSNYNKLAESFDFFEPDDFEKPFEEDIPSLEVDSFPEFDSSTPDTQDDIPPLLHDDTIEDDFDDTSILPDDLLDELDEVSELVYVGGSDD
jgi:hypothetical protein